MTKHYADYFWKDGKPKGIQPTNETSPLSFRIITDPYHKRYSIEKYVDGVFSELTYDSFLLDFRKLNPLNQTAWQRIVLTDEMETQKCLIRDIDDRVVLVEELFFEQNRCMNCNIFSPHGIFLAAQKIFLEERNDPFNGVVLCDRLHKMVMHKKYSLGDDGEFADVLEESWDSHNLMPETHCGQKTP